MGRNSRKKMFKWTQRRANAAKTAEVPNPPQPVEVPDAAEADEKVEGRGACSDINELNEKLAAENKKLRAANVALIQKDTVVEEIEREQISVGNKTLLQMSDIQESKLKLALEFSKKRMNENDYTVQCTKLNEEAGILEKNFIGTQNMLESGLAKRMEQLSCESIATQICFDDCAEKAHEIEREHEKAQDLLVEKLIKRIQNLNAQQGNLQNDKTQLHVKIQQSQGFLIRLLEKRALADAHAAARGIEPNWHKFMLDPQPDLSPGLAVVPPNAVPQPFYGWIMHERISSKNSGRMITNFFVPISDTAEFTKKLDPAKPGYLEKFRRALEVRQSHHVIQQNVPKSHTGQQKCQPEDQKSSPQMQTQAGTQEQQFLQNLPRIPCGEVLVVVPPDAAPVPFFGWITHERICSDDINSGRMVSNFFVPISDPDEFMKKFDPKSPGMMEIATTEVIFTSQNTLFCL